MLSNEMLDMLIEKFDALLKDLIARCYKAPDISLLKSKPNFFETVFFNDKEYVVNYRTDTVGMLIFSVASKIGFLKRARNMNESITMTFVREQN